MVLVHMMLLRVMFLEVMLLLVRVMVVGDLVPFLAMLGPDPAPRSAAHRSADTDMQIRLQQIDDPVRDPRPQPALCRRSILIRRAGTGPRSRR